MDSLQHAIQYARRGWAVFPVHGKRPPKGYCWRDRSTAAEGLLRRDFIRYGDNGAAPNVGLDCGKSGLVIIDLDVGVGKDGPAAWKGLKAEHGFDDAGALMAKSGGGGQHVIFSDPTGGAIGNSAGRLGPGVDVRGNGGYVVAPGSVHPETGALYEQIGDWDRDPGPLPPEIVDLLLGSASPEPVAPTAASAPGGNGRDVWAETALANELAALARAQVGARNDRLNRSAFAMGQIVGAGLLDRGDVERALVATTLRIGLKEREALATLRSGLEAGMKDPRGPKGEGRKGETPSLTRASDGSDVLLRYGPEDEGNAQTVAEVCAGRFLHCSAYGWLHWTGTHWSATDAEAILDRAVVETLKHRRAAAVMAEKEAIVKTAKTSAYRVRGCKYLLTSLLTANVRHFDESPDHLNCRNGMVNLQTGELSPHDASQHFTYCCPVDFDLEADQSGWIAFLREALGDQAIIDYVQEAVGYSLTGHTNEEILFYIHGPARAGKGTFTETVITTLGGRPLADEVDFATFTADRSGDTQNFDLAGLKPCRLIVASESGKYSKLNAAKIKVLTGGNEIRCAHKHRDFFSYRPRFKIWLSSNHPVNTDVDDDAAWHRLRVIHFPNSYAGREDKALKARLKEPPNLAGVLAWAVLGAMAWYGRGSKGLQTPEVVAVSTESARQELDYVAQWLDECVESASPDAFLPNDTLYTSYQAWCRNNGVTPKHVRSLTISLKRRGYRAGEQKKIQGQKCRGCYGVQLVSPRRLQEELGL